MKKLKTIALVPGLIVGESVVNPNGKLLINRGVRLTSKLIEQLQEQGIKEVNILQSTDVLPAFAPIRKKTDRIYHKTQSTEQLQQLVEEMIRNELINLSNIHFHSLFISLDYATLHWERMEALIRNIAAQTPLIHLLILFKGLHPEYLHRYSKIMVLSLMLGIDLGLEDDRLQTVGTAALTFNCGHHIQPNDAKAAYESHPEAGYLFLKKFFDEEVARVSLEHHERVGGGGFPHDRHGSELSLPSKIVMVAGKFISMQYGNNIRKAIRNDLAFDYILSGEGILFDLNVVNAFRKFIYPYPLGSVLEMNDGTRGMVIKHGVAPEYTPFVKILYSPCGRFENGAFVPFQETESTFIKSDHFVWL